jgi:dephospho-CoA kinase
MMKEIPLTPNGKALVDDDDYGRVSVHQWRADISHGYVYANIRNEDGGFKKTYLHRFIMNPQDGFVVDHINRDKKDNRKENLQVVTQQENAMYQKRNPHPNSGYIGVRPSKTGAKWRSSIMVGGEEIYIGRFDNRHDAAREYNETAIRLLGSRADLNEIYVPKIALTGKIRSGKSAISEYLTKKYGFTRYAFGDELKRLVHLVFDVDDINGKPRRLYQFFGQVCRQYDSSIWLRKVLRKIKDDNPEDILIEDCRQTNEYQALKERGYVIIRVKCPDEIRIERAKADGDAFNTADLAHETESYIDTFAVDYEINNAGTLDELYAQVDVIMAGLK